MEIEKTIFDIMGQKEGGLERRKQMILIVAKSIVLDGKREGFLKAAKIMETESRKEDGCISYTLYEDIQEPQKFCCIEQWKDEKAVDAHNNSRHFQTMVPKMNQYKVVPTEVQLYCEIE